MALRFEKKTVLVTGAATGIGWAIAKAFQSEGARMTLLDRDANIMDLVKKLGDNHLARTVDVRNEDAVSEAVQASAAHFGHIDILVNNAGIGPLAPAESFPTDDWEQTLDINLKGAFFMARAVAPGMLGRGSGRIINLASQASVIGIEGHVAYCASKAGLIGMTNCMALEWGPCGVTVNALSPTVVETELGMSGWAGEKGVRARAAIPTRRFAKPAEIAGAVLYLASDEAAMVNGANQMIDGGYTIA